MVGYKYDNQGCEHGEIRTIAGADKVELEIVMVVTGNINYLDSVDGLIGNNQ